MIIKSLLLFIAILTLISPTARAGDIVSTLRAKIPLLQSDEECKILLNIIKSRVQGSKRYSVRQFAYTIIFIVETETEFLSYEYLPSGETSLLTRRLKASQPSSFTKFLECFTEWYKDSQKSKDESNNAIKNMLLAQTLQGPPR